MKKVLLATTVLAAVSVATPVLAEVTVTGSYRFGWSSFSDDAAEDVGQDSVTEAYTDSEIHIKFSETTDSGLTYSATFELEGDEGNGNNAKAGNSVDEASLSLSGDFGTFILGDNDYAHDSFITSAPTHHGAITSDSKISNSNITAAIPLRFATEAADANDDATVVAANVIATREGVTAAETALRESGFDAEVTVALADLAVAIADDANSNVAAVTTALATVRTRVAAAETADANSIAAAEAAAADGAAATVVAAAATAEAAAVTAGVAANAAIDTLIAAIPAAPAAAVQAVIDARNDTIAAANAADVAILGAVAATGPDANTAAADALVAAADVVAAADAAEARDAASAALAAAVATGNYDVLDAGTATVKAPYYAGNASYGDNTKITYMSPDLSGFKFGVSVSDSADEGSADISLGASFSGSTGMMGEMMDDGMMGGGMTYKITANSFANSENGESAQGSVALGAEIGLGDLTITASTLEGKSGSRATENLLETEATQFGVGYAVNDSLSIGASMVEGEEKSTNQELDVTSLSMEYSIAPGLAATAAWNTYSATDTTVAGAPRSNDATSLVFSIIASF